MICPIRSSVLTRMIQPLASPLMLLQSSGRHTPLIVMAQQWNSPQPMLLTPQFRMTSCDFDFCWVHTWLDIFDTNWRRRRVTQPPLVLLPTSSCQNLWGMFTNPRTKPPYYLYTPGPRP